MTTSLPAQLAAGYYPDQRGVMRFWDGARWTEHTAPVPAPAQTVVVPQPTRMVTKSRKRTSHGLHLFLTICTLGFWGVFVWLPITIIHKFTHDKTVTRVG